MRSRSQSSLENRRDTRWGDRRLSAKDLEDDLTVPAPAMSKTQEAGRESTLPAEDTI
jgi:hypothetical protein